MKILALIEQWCDGNPACGFSQPATHYFGHFRHDELRVIYWDSTDCLEASVEQALREKPDLCVFTGPPHPKLPPNAMLDHIGSQTKLVALWHDVAKGGYRNIPGVALNVGMDGVESCPLPNYLPMWTPVSDVFFSPVQKFRPIDILHPGSRGHKSMGREIESVLKSKGLTVTWGGGQREDRLTWAQYFGLISQAKIVLDFPRDVGTMNHQIKGRVFEAAVAGAALVTEDNAIIQRFFKPDQEVGLFHSAEECADICAGLLDWEVRRILMAQKSQKRFEENWTAKHWWEKLIAAL